MKNSLNLAPYTFLQKFDYSAKTLYIERKNSLAMKETIFRSQSLNIICGELATSLTGSYY
jgi:hypothetical protein